MSKEQLNIIEKFYSAFADLDAARMTECYHDAIVFEDPAFGVLQGEAAKNMWRMLCKSQKGKDFRVIASNIEYTPQGGKAHWEAFYTFSSTGRKIHNVINATFKIEDGKIINHKDSFNLYNWAKQALGLKGFFLGWTPFFKKQLNKQTLYLLSEFQKKQKSDI
ncbi:nuclear transport factor 2 family protein [Aequorivita sp. F47161]|uniref:Nuclear transport factor 2 family protein n=1 Tax=Aequorivita vitellina TaxID=2874475 RepID=A0A9X1QVC6_9FLAO|nr:nuclear transport factor 2 family protein [Aequorivita vitellina]